MKDLDTTLQKLIEQQFNAEGYEVDLVPIPARGDRMVRLRTLEEILDELDDGTTTGGIGYLVQVKPRGAQANKYVATMITPPPSNSFGDANANPHAPTKDPVYLPDGKLNTPYLLRNAELLFQSGDPALARNIFRTVRESGERVAHCLFWMGRCYEAEKRLPDAVDAYEESIAFHPTMDSFRRLAQALAQLGKARGAAEVLERALSMKDIVIPMRAAIHRDAAEAWSRAGDSARSEAHHTMALELEPASEETRLALAKLCLKAGRVAEAQRHYQGAISSNARNAAAHIGLGDCALAAGNAREAHDAFARALGIDLNHPTALFSLVKCAYEIKSYATAARLVGEYVGVAPVSVHLLYSLAGLQFHLGRLAEARTTTVRILDLQPGHSGATDLLGMIDRYVGN